MRCVTLFAPTTVSFPSAVADARVFITSFVLSKVCVIEAILLTICSIAEEDSATLAAWFSILPLRFFIVRIISPTVAAVSLTLAAWVRACFFTPSIFALISCTALAVSVILLTSSEPVFVISSLFSPTILIDVPIFSIVWLKYSDKLVTSLFPTKGRRTVRSPSPWAISLRAETTTFMGFSILYETIKSIAKLTAKIVKPINIILLRRVSILPINCFIGALIITVQSVLPIFA